MQNTTAQNRSKSNNESQNCRFSPLVCRKTIQKHIKHTYPLNQSGELEGSIFPDQMSPADYLNLHRCTHVEWEYSHAEYTAEITTIKIIITTESYQEFV